MTDQPNTDKTETETDEGAAYYGAADPGEHAGEARYLLDLSRGARVPTRVCLLLEALTHAVLATVPAPPEPAASWNDENRRAAEQHVPSGPGGLVGSALPPVGDGYSRPDQGGLSPLDPAWDAFSGQHDQPPSAWTTRYDDGAELADQPDQSADPTVPPGDSEARTPDHYPGRGGW